MKQILLILQSHWIILQFVTISLLSFFHCPWSMELMGASCIHAYTCMYAWIYACMHECMYIYVYVCIYAWMYACTHTHIVCKYVCMYAWIIVLKWKGIIFYNVFVRGSVPIDPTLVIYRGDWNSTHWLLQNYNMWYTLYEISRSKTRHSPSEAWTLGQSTLLSP